MCIDSMISEHLVNSVSEYQKLSIRTMLSQGIDQYQVNVDTITSWFWVNDSIIIGSISISNVKPIFQKWILSQCHFRIPSQYWGSMLTQ